MKIGIFDSGVGGLTVLEDLKNEYKHEYIYLADLINSPYGEKTREQLEKILYNILDYYVNIKVDMIIIACGTLSSLAISLEITNYKGIKVINVIDSVVDNLKVNKASKVYLIATNATIKQGSFTNKISQVVNTVEDNGCPKFVPIIENGIDDEIKIESAITEYIPYDRVSKFDNEYIVLGCTHYPILKSSIEKYLNKNKLNIKVVSPGEAMVKYCKAYLKDNQTSLSYSINTTKYTETFKSFCEKMLNIDLKINTITIK